MNKLKLSMAVVVLATVTAPSFAFWSNNFPGASYIPGRATDLANGKGSVHQEINNNSLRGYPFSFRGNNYFFSAGRVDSLNATTSDADDDKRHTYIPEEHFDGESLILGFKYLQGRRTLLRNTLATPDQPTVASTASVKILGYMLHQIQDFYSHTSYLEQLPHAGALPPIVNFGVATSDPSTVAPIFFTTPDPGSNVCTTDHTTLLSPESVELTSGYYDASCKLYLGLPNPTTTLCSNNDKTPAKRCNHGDLRTNILNCATGLVSTVRKDGINKDSSCVTLAGDTLLHEEAKALALEETQSFVAAIVKDLQDTQNGPGFCTLLGINPSFEICAPAKVDQSPKSFVKGTPTAAFSPLTNIGWGATAYTCTSSPATLPTGLSLKIVPPTPTAPGRCEVYGTPTEATAAKSYTFRVAAVGGRAQDSGKASVVNIAVTDTTGYWELQYTISNCVSGSDIPQFVQWDWNAPCNTYINFNGTSGRIFFEDDSAVVVAEAQPGQLKLRSIRSESIRSSNSTFVFSSPVAYRLGSDSNLIHSEDGIVQYTFSVLSRSEGNLAGSFSAIVPSAYEVFNPDDTTAGNVYIYKTMTSQPSGTWTAVFRSGGRITTNLNGYDYCLENNIAFRQYPLSEQPTNPRIIPSTSDGGVSGGCVFGQP